MLMVPRLDGAEDMDRGNSRAGESAIVHDFLNARATGRDLGGEISQAAGTITDHGGETAEPAVCDEAPFHDPAQHVGIDVTPPEKEDDAFAGKFLQLSGEAGRPRRGRGALP